jgi:putative copper export protein/methionine-rich copper-binding protein CopC
MRRLFTFFIALIGAMALFASPASAAGDNTIASSSPAAGEAVTVAPTQLQLRFTLPVGGADAVGKMGLSLACESKLTNLGPPVLAADGLTISSPLTQILSNGTCVVNWSLPDGSAGSYSFQSNAQVTTTVATTVAPGQPTPSTLPDGTTVTENAPRLGGPIGLMRWIAFFMVSALFGGLIFIKRAWPEGVEYGITEKYFRQICIFSLTSLFVLMGLMTAQQSGGSLASSIAPTSWGPLFDTNDGRAIFIRFIAVAGLTYYAWITERIFEATNIVPTTILLSLTMISFGFDRMSGRAVVLGILFGIAHMALIAIWIGSIAIIWRVILHGPGDIDLVHALRTWARIATPLTIGIVFTGVFQVWRVDGLSLINSGHGRVVLVKILSFAALIVVSSSIRQFIVRGMERAKSLNEKVVYRLKRPVGLELSLSVFVLALSSWMMSMRPPYVSVKQIGPEASYAIVQDLIGKDDFHVRLSLTPGDVGANKILIELFGPARIQNFTVSLTPSEPTFSGYTINVPITRPGAALVSQNVGLKLLAPGTWTAVIKGVTTTGDLEPLSTTFVIADGTTVITVPKQGLKAPESTTTSVPLASSTTTTLPAVTTTLPAVTTTVPPASGVTTTLPAG